MAFDKSCDPDGFAAALSDLVSEPLETVVDGGMECVREGLKDTRAKWKANADLLFNGERYAKSISYTTRGRDKYHPGGEVGSPTLPGLPHLLEKGHAKVGGGFVPGREHIDPAAKSGFDTTTKAFEELIGRALS
jgi:hypothetical protein